MPDQTPVQIASVTMNPDANPYPDVQKFYDYVTQEQE
jgi:hypothetical protein